jgi:hypothetical protein
MLRNLREADFFKLRLPDLRTGIRRIFGQFYKIYLLSCLHLMKPKIVLTFVDDSPRFHFVSRKYRGAQFYAITNGIRYQPVIPQDKDYRISMPDLICYGEFEADFFRRHGHLIDNFHPVGSLQGGYYKALTTTGNGNSIEYDLCLVSQWFDGIISGSLNLPEIRRAITTLEQFLATYLDENKLRFCVAMRGESPFEIEYFSKIYGDRAVLLKNKRLSMSTYRGMDRSSVIVAFDSSAAIDAYGWGKKVLFTNFSGTDNSKLPVDQTCYIDETSYAAFRDKLDFIRELSEEKYAELTGKNRKYVVNYDPQCPAHVYVRNLIKKDCRMRCHD